MYNVPIKIKLELRLIKKNDIKFIYTYKNLNTPTKPAFNKILAKNILISEDTSTCTLSSQK